MTIRKLFLLLFLLLTTVLIAGGGVIFSKSFDVLSGSRFLEHEEIPVLNRSHELKLSVVQVQQWLTDISATRGRDGLNDGFEQAEENAQRFKQLISELSILDPKNKSHYQAMLPVFDEYYRAGKKMAHAYIEQGPAGGNKIMAEFDQSAAQMGESVDALLTGIDDDTNQKLYIQESASTSVIYITSAVFIAVLLIVAVLYFVMSSVVNTLNSVSSVIKSIASGNLDVAIDCSKKGEVGDLPDCA